MQSQSTVSIRSDFSIQQYGLYIFLGVCIWLLGVAIVRIAGEAVFADGSTLLIVFYGLSIPIGVVNMLVLPRICRLPTHEMMVPALVMIFVTLMMDGIAVSFTDVYSVTDESARYAAGWLLWSFGIQIAVSMWFVQRASQQ